MSALVTAFEQLIPPFFVLDRQGSYWIIQEPEVGNCRFEIAGGKSQAFTLDRQGMNVFPFLTVALQGVQSVNDAIVVAVVGQETYVVAVELKTSAGKISDALKQIESCRLFMRWIRELLSFYGHWRGGGCKFFGVVSLQPRRQVRKGSTTRSAELPTPIQSPHGGYSCFVLENHPRVSIMDLVRKLTSTNASVVLV